VRIDMSRMTAAAIEAALDDGKQQQRRPRLSGMRAVATGAALAVAARAAVKHGPGLAHMRHLASIPDLVRDRLAEHGWLPDDEERDDAEYDDDSEAEGDEDFDDEHDDDFEAEGDEDFDDENEDDDFDGPEAEAEGDDEPDEGEQDDEDFDDEPAAEVGHDEHADEERDADVDEDEGEAERDEANNGRRTTAQGRRSAPSLEVPGNGGRAPGEVPEVLELLSTRRSRPPVMCRRRRAPRVDPVLRPPEPPERESDDAKAGTRK
jgi:hypothetical protein